MNLRSLSEPKRQWLATEMEDWRHLGLISSDQADQIRSLYETDADISRRKRAAAWFALSGVGSLMVGVAVLLLVGYNWSAMHAAVKLLIIFGVLFGTHALGFWLRYRVGKRIASEIVFLLGCLFWGAAIALIGQIFNIHAHYPDAIWLWALCVLPFALGLDTLLLHLLYAGLLAAWAGTEILGFADMPWFFSGRVAIGAYSLPLLALPGMLWAYRKRSPTTVGIYAALLAWWIVLLPIAWRFDVDVLFFIAAAGALFLLIAEMHSAGSLLAAPYRALGASLTVIALTPLGFGEFLSQMPYHTPANNNYLAAAIIASFGAVAALAVVLLRRFDGQAGSPLPFMAILRRQWMPTLLFLLPIGLCLWCGLFNHYSRGEVSYNGHLKNAVHNAFWLSQIIAIIAVNVVSLIFAGWLTQRGLHEESTQWFNAGVGYFLLWTVLRYIDLFGEVGGMLGASAMFLLCGIALFAVARFWVHRKGKQDA
jgi:uncharacterized membrane protein